MYPKRKTHLIGRELQGCRILRGPSIEDLPGIRAKWKENGNLIIQLESGDFYVDGLPFPNPTKHRETWDVIRFTSSGYFNFNGERIAMRQITDYNPSAGTFQTPDGFFTLYPLPTA